MSTSSNSSKSDTEHKNKIIKLSNDLLTICHQSQSIHSVPKTINSTNELNSNIFIFIYENICNAGLIDKRTINTEEDEIHNIQAVIDSLSLDVLHEDLSHLTGESIRNAINPNNKLKPDYISVVYLLDILRCIHEWVTSRLESNTTETTIESKLIEPVPINQNHEIDNIKQKEIENDTKQEEIDYKQKEIEDDLKEEEQQIFKEYMKQKEQEYKMNKIKQETSSGNSSLSSSNTSIDSDTSCILKQVNNFYQLPKRQVTFEPKLIQQPHTIQTINNELEQMRLSLQTNLNNEQTKINSLLKTVYSDDLKDAKSIIQQSLTKYKNKSDLTNQLYLTAFNDSNRPKSSLTVSRSSRSKGVLFQTIKCVKPVQKNRSLSASIDSALKQRTKSTDTIHSKFTIGENGILNALLQEFPYLYTSPETIHFLWEKHSKQIETFSKLHKEIEGKYLRAESATSTKVAEHHLEESYKKQEMLMEIMRKDLQHLQRMQDMKRKIECENSMKSRQREQRFQTAKVKRYFEEFRLQQRAKMLKKNTSEELVFKKLFNESLKIQKERLFEMKRYAKEKSELNTKEQLNQIKSIENFYKNKFDLLNEQLNRDKDETLTRERAQHVVLSKMKSQVKKKLESDIRDLQDQMAQDKDSLYWREMDAKRIQKDLYAASYFKPKK